MACGHLRLGAGALLAAGIFACGGNVEDDDLGARGIGGSSNHAAIGGNTSQGTYDNGVGGAAAITAGAPQGGSFDMVVGPGNQFIEATDEALHQVQSLACFGIARECEPLPGKIEYVVDVSAAMIPNWLETQSAVDALIASGAFAQYAGISFFPNRATQPDDSGGLASLQCLDTSLDVPLALNDDNQSMTIRKNLATANPQADAGAPIQDAYDAAVQQLLAFTQGPTWAQPVVVLVTDGAPTLSLGCQGANSWANPEDTSPLLGAIGAAQQMGVDTVVIGAPGSDSTPAGSDARPWLSQAASAGGTALCDCSNNGPNYCHLDMTQSTDISVGLPRALRKLGCQLNSCGFQLPPPPAGSVVDASQTTVVYRGGTNTWFVRQNPASNCQYGWHFTNNGSTIELCPGTCAALQCETYVSISINVGCKLV